MVAAIAEPQLQIIEMPLKRPSPRYVSWKEFERRYLAREDGYKYEWTNGVVEKTPRTMNLNQLYISDNLTERLDLLKKDNPTLWKFYVEPDVFLDPVKHRRPDLAYFSKQEVRMAYANEKPVPAFAIEIISSSDNINRVNKKVKLYFDAGVQVLWHIFPDLKEVYVYENDRRALVCRGDDLCSAEQAIPGFVMSVREIFKAP